MSKRDLEMARKGYTKVEVSLWIKTSKYEDFLRELRLLADRYKGD